MSGFSVNYRNPGHWDIYDSRQRLFCIRGDIGNVVVRDERDSAVRVTLPKFKTVAGAMAYITDILMFERLASDGDSMVDSSGNQLLAISKD
jgi:hypothetical protein